MKRRRLDTAIALLVLPASLSLILGRSAHADQSEVSLHAHVHSGQATLGELETTEAVDTAPFLGAGARATYAINDWYAFEASLGYSRLTKTVQYSLEPRIGKERHWNMDWTQANLGITGRFGARLIPTLHATLGAQRRVWQGQELERDSPNCRPERNEIPPLPCIRATDRQTTMDLVGTLGAGLDYRLGDNWITGLAVSAQRAVVTEARFQTIVATFHISYYFYPEGDGAEP